jgi:hypothetical protein
VTRFVKKLAADPKGDVKVCAVCGRWPAPIRPAGTRLAYCEEHRP